MTWLVLNWYWVRVFQFFKSLMWLWTTDEDFLKAWPFLWCPAAVSKLDRGEARTRQPDVAGTTRTSSTAPANKELEILQHNEAKKGTIYSSFSTSLKIYETDKNSIFFFFCSCQAQTEICATEKFKRHFCWPRFSGKHPNWCFCKSMFHWNWTFSFYWMSESRLGRMIVVQAMRKNVATMLWPPRSH